MELTIGTDGTKSWYKKNWYKWYKKLVQKTGTNGTKNWYKKNWYKWYKEIDVMF